MGARRQRGVDVSAFIVGERKAVAFEPPNGMLGLRFGDGPDRIGDRPQHVVVDVDQRRRSSGCLAVLGHHDRQHVTEIGRATAYRDHHGPVLVDDAHPQFAGHVGRGQHPYHPGNGEGSGRVDPYNVGPGVIAQAQRPVQQAGHDQVVDIGAATDGQVAGLVLGAA